MSNSVVRLSGSQACNAASVRNLVSFLSKSNTRKFLVVSSLPVIRDILYHTLENACENDTGNFVDKVNNVYAVQTGRKASLPYTELVEQVKAILTGIRLTGDYSNSLKDHVASFSEKLTTEIFRTLLQDAGVDSKILQPHQFGLLATEDYGNATFLAADKQILLELPAGIYLIPGSYGVTGNGKISRAGKTAADYTAAFLTRVLNAEKLELYGIEKPFLRTSPDIVAGAPKVSRLTYSEASELAYFDHYSFHPRTVEPLEDEHIPVVIINADTGKGGIDTTINTETFIEEQIVKSVACSDDISLLRLNGPGVGLKPGILAKVTSKLNEEGINIRSVITSHISINLILEKNTGAKALALIRQLGFSSVKEISVIDDVSLIGVVGHGMQQNYGVSAKIFNAVARNRINVVLSGSGASDLVSYLVVKSSDKEKSVRVIYNAFFKTPQEINEFINQNINNYDNK